MNLIQKQISNEFKSTHHLTSHIKEDLIKSGLGELASEYVKKLVNHISTQEYEYVVKDEIRIWQSKKDRHEKLLKMNLEDLAWKVIAISTCTPIQTYTSIVGQLKGIFKNDTIRQDIEMASECVAIADQIGVITIVKPVNTEEGVMMVHSKIEYDGNLGEFLTNTRHIMPSLTKPKIVNSNSDSGYGTFSSSLILGGKYHDKSVPLDHINRMNSVALRIEPRVIKQNPIFKEKDGETSNEREERYSAWKQFNVETVGIYADLVSSGNRFYLTHKYDERLRTYAHGYHVNTQGDSYRKSAVELANKEVVPYIGE